MFIEAFDRFGDAEGLTKKDRKKTQRHHAVDSGQQRGAGTVYHLIVGHQTQYDNGQQTKGNFFI